MENKTDLVTFHTVYAADNIKADPILSAPADSLYAYHMRHIGKKEDEIRIINDDKLIDIEPGNFILVDEGSNIKIFDKDNKPVNAKIRDFILVDDLGNIRTLNDDVIQNPVDSKTGELIPGNQFYKMHNIQLGGTFSRFVNGKIPEHRWEDQELRALQTATLQAKEAAKAQGREFSEKEKKELETNPSLKIEKFVSCAVDDKMQLRSMISGEIKEGGTECYIINAATEHNVRGKKYCASVFFNFIIDVVKKYPQMQQIHLLAETGLEKADYAVISRDLEQINKSTAKISPEDLNTMELEKFGKVMACSVHAIGKYLEEGERAHDSMLAKKPSRSVTLSRRVIDSLVRHAVEVGPLVTWGASQFNFVPQFDPKTDKAQALASRQVEKFREARAKSHERKAGESHTR